MNKTNLGIVIISDEKNILQGVFTDGDLRRLACKENIDYNKSISEVMTKNPKYIQESEKSAKALDLMEEKQITVLPVVNNDKEKN